MEQRGPVVRALRAGIADFGFADGVRVVELQAPRQRGGPAVELLVEPVAESADGLGHGQRGGDGIGEDRERIVLVAAPQERHQGADGDAAEDGHAAFPHLEDVDQVAGGREVVGRRGDAVVKARAHQCAGHGDERGVENLVEGAAVPLPTCGEDPYGHADADQDADRVHVDSERADLELGEGRRGNISQIHRASTCWCSWCVSTRGLCLTLCDYPTVSRHNPREAHRVFTGRCGCLRPVPRSWRRAASSLPSGRVRSCCRPRAGCARARSRR